MIKKVVSCCLAACLLVTSSLALGNLSRNSGLPGALTAHSMPPLPEYNNDGRNVDVGYLLREGFFNTAGSIGLSGWETKNINTSYINNIIVSDNTQEEAYIKKTFIAQEKQVTADWRVIPTKVVNGGEMKLMNGSDDAITLKINDSKLYYIDESDTHVYLVDLDFSRWTGIRVKADIASNTVDIMVDGLIKLTGAAFSQATDSLNTIYFGIDAPGTGSYSLGNVYVYTGYAVYEDLNVARKTDNSDQEGNLNLGVSMRASALEGAHDNNTVTAYKAVDGDPATYWEGSDVSKNRMNIVACYRGAIKKVNKVVIKTPEEGLMFCFGITYLDASDNWASAVEDTDKSTVIMQPTEMKTSAEGGTVIYFKEPIYAKELAISVWDPDEQYDRLKISEFEAYYEGNEGGMDEYVLPEDWTWETPVDETKGSVAVYERAAFTKDNEFNTFRLTDNSTSDRVRISKKFTQAYSTVYDYDFLFGQKADGMATELRQAGGNVIRIFTKNGDVYLTATGDSKEYVIVKGYIPNNWYRLNLKYDHKNNKIVVKVNGWFPVEDIAVSQSFANNVFDEFIAETTPDMTGFFMVDNIRIYPLVEREVIPKPEPIDTGKYKLVMQSCSLWRAGNHISWPLNQQTEPIVKPLLGWYDEGDPVVFDWQVKWLVEHGVSTIMYCWYRPDVGAIPIKETMQSDELWQGHFGSRYGEYLDFALQFTNAQFSVYGPDDFKQNLVPHWIETFFKNPNYLKTSDNEPIIYFYDPTWFRTEIGDFDGDGNAGTNADVQAALDYFRNECKKAGFGGLKVVAEYRGTSQGMLQSIALDGYDFSYAYTWGAMSREASDMEMLESINNRIQIQQDTYKNLGFKTREFPTITRMLDSYIWIENGYAIDSPRFTFDISTFKHHVEWVKNQFDVPVIDSAGNKMIMIDNWNEFQEGHYFLPCYGTQAYEGGVEGFGPLDVLRDVFGLGEYTHTDILPLEAGYGPYDKWTPSGWNLEYGRPAIDPLKPTQSARVDPVLGANAIAGSASFQKLTDEQKALIDAVTDGILVLDASQASRVNVDPALLACLIENELGFTAVTACGTVTLSPQAVAKLDGEKSLDIVLGQLIDVTDVKAVMGVAKKRLIDNLAYTFSLSQSGQAVELPATVTIKTSHDGLQVARATVVYEDEGACNPKASACEAVSSTVKDGALWLQAKTGGLYGVYKD